MNITGSPLIQTLHRRNDMMKYEIRNMKHGLTAISPIFHFSYFVFQNVNGDKIS